MSLEDKVNDAKSDGLIKKTLKLGYAATMAGATTLLSTATLGATGPIIGMALAAGSAIGSAIKGTKTIYQNVLDSLKTYSTINLVVRPIFAGWDWIMPKIPGEGLLGVAAKGLFASTAFNAFFEGMYKGGKHLVDNYLNPIGIVKSIKHNFYNDWKRSAIGFSPGYTMAANGFANLSAFGLPPIIPTFAYNAFGLGMYNAINPAPIKQNGTAHAPKYGNGLSTPAGAH